MTKFTDFFTKATYEEKEKVFKEVAKRASKEQQNIMKTKKLTIAISWHKNDNFSDKRPITIDYTDEKDLKEKQLKIVNDFKTKPMDITLLFDDWRLGMLPYKVVLY